ncbi:MAG: molybdenum cofactor guanylyltransferase [Elstera sp.]
MVSVILAGGAGTRIGGDKALQLLGGRPLIAHVAARCGLPLWINASDPRLADYGTLVPDLPSLGQGPLVGVWSALCAARAAGFERVLTVPVDTPFLPADLPERLIAALGDAGAAVAATAEGWHATCALWRVSAEPVLADRLAAGHWSLQGALRAFSAAVVDFEAELTPLFFNINTRADLAVAEAMRG